MKQTQETFQRFSRTGNIIFVFRDSLMRVYIVFRQRQGWQTRIQSLRGRKGVSEGQQRCTAYFCKIWQSTFRTNTATICGKRYASVNGVFKKKYFEIKVKEQMNLETDNFRADETFPEAQLPKMGKVAMKVLSIKDEEFYEGMGKYFVTIAQEAGYGNTLLALGRRIRDFFLNLDNLHDYLKFTFPKMKAPSFFIEAEDENGLHMQYRTRRKGFHYYVQGQVG